ncbi:GspH/FimT family pseudopilin [Granulosicoccaceae sp. 1_MG-2023]|nr:GspH/FimT family pseudopilin [Granulosicoccaceae sp. 1_MG-2023]
MTRNRSTGFSLIELLVTLAVASILIAFGVPSFANLVAGGRQSDTYNELVSSIGLARSEAVKRASTITVCGYASDTQCAGDNDWSKGWLVFEDLDADGTVDSGEDLLAQKEISYDDQSVQALSFSGSNGFRYFSRGNVSSTGYLVVCDSRGAEDAKALNVTTTGGVRKAIDSNNDNIVENLSGQNVSCPAGS